MPKTYPPDIQKLETAIPEEVPELELDDEALLLKTERSFVSYKQGNKRNCLMRVICLVFCCDTKDLGS
jgi:hypothetical protein